MPLEGRGALGGFSVDCEGNHVPKWKRYAFGESVNNSEGRLIGLVVCKSCGELIDYGVPEP